MPVNLSIAHRITLHGLNPLGFRDVMWTDHVKHPQPFNAKWMISKSLLGKKNMTDVIIICHLRARGACDGTTNNI